MVYIRGAWCPFCLRQLADYADRYQDFKQAGVEVVAVSPESSRRSRRLRSQLKLPFAILSDKNREAATSFGLMGHEKPGEPTPATVVVDTQRRVRLSTLNKWEKCLVARDTLEFARALKQGAVDSIRLPRVESPRPGFLFARGVANMLAGLVIR